MTTARDFVDGRIDKFQARRKTAMFCCFYPAAALFVVGVGLGVYAGSGHEKMGLGLSGWGSVICVALALALSLIGSGIYRCPVCKRGVTDAEGSTAYDPISCIHCGTRLKHFASRESTV